MPRKPYYWRQFPYLLEAAMRRANLSQAEASRALKMSPSAMSEWLSGKRCPRINVVRMLAKVLKAPIKALTGQGRLENLSGGVPGFHSVPVFQVAAGAISKPKRLADVMDLNFTRTRWECRLCGNSYEFDDMSECPVDGEPRPGEADPRVIARKRIEKLACSRKPERAEVEDKVREVLEEMQAEGLVVFENRESVEQSVMQRFGVWLARLEPPPDDEGE